MPMWGKPPAFPQDFPSRGDALRHFRWIFVTQCVIVLFVEIWTAFGLLAACTVLAHAGAAVLIWRSTPARVKADARQALEVAERLRSDWTRQLVDLESVREAIEGTLEAVERKRKSTAGSASRLAAKEREEAAAAAAAAAQVAEYDPNNLDHLRERARNRGMFDQ